MKLGAFPYHYADHASEKQKYRGKAEVAVDGPEIIDYECAIVILHAYQRRQQI